jgi:glycosyltransferase involved in cell wall biosynthesis
VVSNLLYRFLFPDMHAGWDRLAAQTIDSLIQSERPDIVVSASGSPTAHIAAASIKRRLNIPWVADFGDPWTMIDRAHRPWFGWLSELVERRTVIYADHLVFTTADCANWYQDWLREDAPPCTVLPYGYRQEDFPASRRCRRPHHCATFAHIGAAYQINRDLRPLIRAMARVQRKGTGLPVQLRVVGNHSRSFDREAHRLGLARYSATQRVSYEESMLEVDASDVIVIVGNREPLQIPGKVYPAIASGRPILYISQAPIDADPARALLAPLPGVVIASNDVGLEDAVEQIRECLGDLTIEASRRADLPQVHEMEAGALSRRFRNILLQSVLGPSAPTGDD